MFFSALLALPIFLYTDFTFFGISLNIMVALILLSSSAPSYLYLHTQKLLYKDWKWRMCAMPALICIGTGLAFNNTIAVWEAISGKVSGFVRTPKKGDKETKVYKVSLPWLPVFEILMGLYCLYSIPFYFESQKYMVGPFLLIYAIGFLYVGIVSLKHSKFLQSIWVKLRS